MGRGQARDLFSSTFGDRRGAPDSGAAGDEALTQEADGDVRRAQGIRLIRSMNDEELLTGVRDPLSEPYGVVMKAMGMHEGLHWHTARCAEEAHRRGLIDEHELDRLRW